MRRRTFVAALGATALGGCLRSGDLGTASETPAPQSTETDTPPTETATPTETEPTPDPDATGSRILTELWREPGSWFAVADGVVYVHNGLRLGAWTADGSVRWTRQDEQVPFGRPVVDGDTLYLLHRTGDGTSVLRALDTADGRDRWETTIDGSVQSLPLPTADTLLLNVADLGGEEGNDAILGLDRASGERLWTQPSGLSSTPGSRRLGTVGGDGFAYVTAGTTSASARVSKLDPATGEREWDWTGETPASEPVYADGSVYVGTYADVTALDADSGEQRWRVETFDTNYALPAVVDGTVYAGSRDTAVYAIEATSGDQRWRTQVGGGIDAVAASGKTVFAGHDGGLAVLEAGGTLATRAAYDRGTSRVTHAADRLFVGAEYATIAYEVGTA